ncbi:uncharacterized protein LOC124265811 [Haliotis rubra]|uniref:uncharacterized protein LOC124265811 n=1 Tax=Haliotis rubra TaxID=36100 RepID=UPI001EE60E13|nr:uncharacterized protein LOC124265811 [Haliotis rubra]
MVKTAPPVKNNDEALHLVLTGDYALLTDQSQIEFLRMTDCENLMSGETPFNVGGLGFIVPESSPLLEILSFNLIQLQEAGLIGKWRRRWWSPSSMCPTSSQTSTVQSLELEYKWPILGVRRLHHLRPPLSRDGVCVLQSNGQGQGVFASRVGQQDHGKQKTAVPEKTPLTRGSRRQTSTRLPHTVMPCRDAG